MAKKASSKDRKRVEPKVPGVVPQNAMTVKGPGKTPPKEEFKVQWDLIQQMEEEVDEKHVNQLTDHVFSSVLSKFGWVRNDEGHLEKVEAGEAA